MGEDAGIWKQLRNVGSMQSRAPDVGKPSPSSFPSNTLAEGKLVAIEGDCARAQLPKTIARSKLERKFIDP